VNKQLGGVLEISEIAVKAHRDQVMRKVKSDVAFQERSRRDERLARSL
jgi:FixJ family two-component response regulator